MIDGVKLLELIKIREILVISNTVKCAQSSKQCSNVMEIIFCFDLI